MLTYRVFHIFRDMFVDEKVRPNYKPLLESSLDYIFNFDENLIVSIFFCTISYLCSLRNLSNGQHQCLGKDLPSQPPGSHFDYQTQDFWENDSPSLRFSVNVQSKGIFQKFYSCKTKGTLNDVKKQTCLAMSIYRVVMIILLNWVTAFRPLKFHKSLVLTPCFKNPGEQLIGVQSTQLVRYL